MGYRLQHEDETLVEWFRDWQAWEREKRLWSIQGTLWRVKNGKAVPDDMAYLEAHRSEVSELEARE